MGPNEARCKMLLQNLNQQTIAKASKDPLFSRQREEDPYASYYTDGHILKPPYDFSFLYQLYEESDALQTNVQVMIKNVVGMGYTYTYLGEDRNKIPEKDNSDKTKLDNFFNECNEEESWIEIASRGREDYEVLGCQAIEVIRDYGNEVALTYHHPFELIRLCILTNEDYLEREVSIMRNGKRVTIPVVRPFRKFVKRTPLGKLRFYKTLGDPRPLLWDGTYGIPTPNNPLASEILYFYNHFGSNAYGMPRWIGSTFDIAGRRDAQALNWDLLRSQGISPMAIMVEGRLTDESWDEIYNMIMGAKGVENFNKIWVLQVNPIPTAIGAKGSANIRIENMTSMQRSDEMFTRYMESTKNNIRESFRNPPGFVGDASSYSYGSMQVSKIIGEEQVFGPERNLWDRRVNKKILQEAFGIYNWRYKSKGAEVSGAEEIRNAIATLTNTGAISINNAIQLANDALGRDFSEYKEIWGDYPLPIILRLIDRGVLKGLEHLSTGPLNPNPMGPPQKGTPEAGVQTLEGVKGTESLSNTQNVKQLAKIEDEAIESNLKYETLLKGSDITVHRDADGKLLYTVEKDLATNSYVYRDRDGLIFETRISKSAFPQEGFTTGENANINFPATSGQKKFIIDDEDDTDLDKQLSGNGGAVTQLNSL